MMSPLSLLEDRPSTGEMERYQREWSRADMAEGGNGMNVDGENGVNGGEKGRVEFDEYGYRRDVKAIAAREREI